MKTYITGVEMSTISFFSAKGIGAGILSSFYVRVYGLFLSKVPDTIFINANLSLCFGSIFAWILKQIQTFFLLLGSTNSRFRFFRSVMVRFQQNNLIVHELQNYSMRNKKTGCFRPDNLGDQI
jgi:hypothetical protein